jgi:hypothetical protein
MHPGHDVPIPDDEALAQSLPVVVEIPQGSKNKIEVLRRAAQRYRDEKR